MLLREDRTQKTEARTYSGGEGSVQGGSDGVDEGGDQGEDGDLLSFLGNMVVRAAARRERGVNFTNSPRRLPLHTR